MKALILILLFALSGCASIHTETKLDELIMRVEILRDDFHKHAIKCECLNSHEGK